MLREIISALRTARVISVKLSWYLARLSPSPVQPGAIEGVGRNAVSVRKLWGCEVAYVKAGECLVDGVRVAQRFECLAIGRGGNDSAQRVLVFVPASGVAAERGLGSTPSFSTLTKHASKSRSYRAQTVFGNVGAFRLPWGAAQRTYVEVGRTPIAFLAGGIRSRPLAAVLEQVGSNGEKGTRARVALPSPVAIPAGFEDRLTPFWIGRDAGCRACGGVK